MGYKSAEVYNLITKLPFVVRQANIYQKTSRSVLSSRLCWWFSCVNAGTSLNLNLDSLFPIDIMLNIWFVFIVQISNKYGLIYVITKLGLLFVYDLESATAVYRNRISPDPIFLTAEASTAGGFYAINRRGQVLLATVNEATIVPFVSGQVFYVLHHSWIVRKTFFRTYF